MLEEMEAAWQLLAAPQESAKAKIFKRFATLSR
jgi:hypothetical protein